MKPPNDLIKSFFKAFARNKFKMSEVWESDWKDWGYRSANTGDRIVFLGYDEEKEEVTYSINKGEPQTVNIRGKRSVQDAGG